jgi:adenylate kinase
MLSNIAFVGGIHGVGKSTICADICQQTNLNYLSASELLKWKEINSDIHNKKVVNIPGTQDCLINRLKLTVQSDKSYLLDGHYCLLDSAGNITPIPAGTFTAMKPNSLHVITGEVCEIKRRLEKRDAKVYDADLLRQFQEKEVEHAKKIAALLSVNLSIGSQADYSQILVAIKRLHTS